MNFRQLLYKLTHPQYPESPLMEVEALPKMILLLVALYFSMAQSLSRRELYVRPASTSVLCPQDPCFSLGEYIKNSSVYFTSGSDFVFLEGEHILNVSVVLLRINSITLSGAGSGTILSVSSAADISFIDSSEVVISSLQVSFQGSADSRSLKSALFFTNSSVEIANVRFTGSNMDRQHSRAISFFQSTAGVTNCSFLGGFSENGGAIHMEDSDVTFSGITMFRDNTADISGGAIYCSNSILVIQDNSTFSKNRATTLLTEVISGGGAVFIMQGSYANISGFSHFVGNGPVREENFLQGGVFKVFNSTLNIQGHGVFTGNSGTFAGAIGAVDANISLQGSMTFSSNRYAGCISLFRSRLSCNGEVNFTNNEIIVAEGFGSAIFSENSTISLSGRITFSRNTALNGVGGAMFTFNSNTHFRGEILFADNHAAGDIGGALCIDRSSLICDGNITFAGNLADYRGGGVYAIDSTITITGSSSFAQNMAVEGGGMGLEGNSKLVLMSPVNINFYRNQAETNGGAILFLDTSSIAQCQNISVEQIDCFFRIDLDDSSTGIRLNFTENTAGSAGRILYGGSLQLCRVRVNGKQIQTDSLQYLQSISTFEGGGSSDITSDPLKVCFCVNGTADCMSRGIRKRSVHRGQLLSFSVITVGQIDTPVPATLRGYIQNNDDTTELIPQSHMINDTCTDVTFRLYTEDTRKFLVLYPDGPCGNTENTRRIISVSLYPCPPGFELVGVRCQCERRILKLNRTNTCDIDTLLIERPGNTWIKPLRHNNNQSYIGFILHPNCPFGYCRSAEDSVWLDFTSNNSDSQCSNNRGGMLCGACKPGYSLTLYNYHCSICQNKSVSLFLFFSFAGVALITVLLVLHMTVATGTINGLILYANIVDVNSQIFFPPGDTNILTVFISWLNLDLGIPTCLYDGLDFYSYAWLDFAFPLYLWFLIGTIVISSKFSAKVGKLFGSNPVAVLATVILLSFTKLLQATIFNLSYTHLEYPDGSTRKVWLFDANFSYFENDHAILAIAALCVIFFLLIPYFLLILFGYRLQKYSGKKAFFWFNRLKPLLDAYYAPYHMHSRYWPGFMLLVRACLYLAFSFNALGDISANLVAISSVFTAVAFIPWLSYRVYDKFYNDILEASFILNICVLSTATYHVITIRGNQAAVTYLSVGVAFLEFLGITLYHVYLRVHKTKAFEFLTCHRLMKEKSGDALHRGRNSSVAKAIPTLSVVSLREPLLEDDSSI